MQEITDSHVLSDSPTIAKSKTRKRTRAQMLSDYPTEISQDGVIQTPPVLRQRIRLNQPLPEISSDDEITDKLKELTLVMN